MNADGEHTCLNLVGELDGLAEAGIERFRISPHSKGTVQVANIFDAVLKSEMELLEAISRLKESGLEAPFSNGFYYRAEGHQWLNPETSAQ